MKNLSTAGILLIIFMLFIVGFIGFKFYNDSSEPINEFTYEITVFNENPNIQPEKYTVDYYRIVNHGASILIFESNGIEYKTTQRFLITKKRK